MFDPTEYPKTYKQYVAIETAEMERLEEQAIEELEARMQAFDRGRCSLGAAVEGGARYERELAESAEFSTETIADPVAVVINDFLRATRAGRAA